MKRGLLIALVLAPMALLLAGCPEVAGGLTGVTVSGTLTGASLSISGPVTVTVSKSGSNASTQVTLTGSGSQSGPYSIANVPTGDYTFVAVFDCSWSFSLSQYYSINGGAQVLCDSDVVTGSGPYTHTVTFSNVPIPAAETIDVDLGDMS